MGFLLSYQGDLSSLNLGEMFKILNNWFFMAPTWHRDTSCRQLYFVSFCRRSVILKPSKLQRVIGILAKPLLSLSLYLSKDCSEDNHMHDQHLSV